MDSGYHTHSAQTVSLVETVLGAQPLHTLVNTHLHSDHCGGNAALQERFPDLETVIPPGHAQKVTDWDPVALTYSPTGQYCPPFAFTQTCRPGETLVLGQYTWEIHGAAGHDPHSLIFFEPISKILISADALWENGFGVVFPELEGLEAFSEVAETFNTIERLNPDLVIPGHGRVFQYTPHVLDLARQRLDAFDAHPLKHANHAAKVLLKFKLLELQTTRWHEFLQWAMQTPYLIEIHQRFFSDVTAPSWIARLCSELMKAGVAMRHGEYLHNQ